MRSLFLQLLFIFTASILFAQTSASGQLKFDVPTTLSACASDTVCVTVFNNKAVKGTTYTGVVKLKVNIPGGVLMKLIPNSLFSMPTGATQTAYAGNVLEVDVPLPAIGLGTKVCFLVQPDCNIGTLLPLPLFTAQATYPAGYPDAVQTVTSAAANLGKGILTATPWGAQYSNAPASWGVQADPNYDAVRFSNSGYGDIKEVLVKTTVPNKFTNPVLQAWDGTFSGAVNVVLVAQVTNPDGSVTYIHKINGTALGSDNVLSPGETRVWSVYFKAPAECTQGLFKYEFSYNCGDGQPSCEAPVKTVSTRTVRDQFPNPVSVLDKYDKIDGCNDPKAYEFTYTNNGTTNGLAYPLVTGVAYDADIYVNFGGTVDISDLTVNGVAINPNDVLFSLGQSLNDIAAYRITFKDRNTNPAYGLVDIDGDGFLDDMPVGVALPVKMKFQTELVRACSGIDYYIYGQLNYRDICRSDKLVYAPPYDAFGFEKLTPTTQTSVNDYGLLYNGTTLSDTIKTQTAKFEFNYKTKGSLVIDPAVASAKLKIRQSEKMELNRGSVKLNGTILTLSSTEGAGDDHTTTTAAAGGTDSTFIYDIPSTMLASLTDGTLDNLEYDMTIFNCQVRQVTKQGDSWSLCLKFKDCGAAGGGEVDLACKQGFSYSFNRGCGVKPCYVQTVKINRVSPIGFTAIDEVSTIAAIDSMRSYECDTVMTNFQTYLNGDWPAGEPNGFWTQQGYPMADGYLNFRMLYPTTPNMVSQGKFPFIFIENESKIIVWPRDPVTGVINKSGAPIIEVPVQVSDFTNGRVGRNVLASSQVDGNDLAYPVSAASSAIYANPANGAGLDGLFPGVVTGFFYHPAGVMISETYFNQEKSKASAGFNLLTGKALFDYGFDTKIWNDDSYAIEYKLKWKPRDDYEWNNLNDFGIDFTNQIHNGNYLTYTQYDYAKFDVLDTNSPVSSYFAPCGNAKATGLVVSKDLVVENPNRSYVTDCGTTVCNKLYMDSYAGQGTSGEGYFRNGEVRVPYKLNDIKVTLPAGFSLVPNTMSLKVNSGCTTQAAYTNITASGTTGLITFTNTAGGDFPRMDDCAGKTTAYEFCYQIQDDNATVVKANLPIYSVFNLTEEIGKPFVLKDTARLSNLIPDLRLTSISPVINNTDGGSCQPATYDFVIYNESDVDANFVHLTVDNSASVTMVAIKDAIAGNNGVDSVKAHGNGLFAYIGKIGARDSIRVSIKGSTNVCSGDFKVVADWGCSFPAPASTTAIETASDHEDVANAQFDALDPKMLSRPVTNTILKIEDLCGEKDVEFEIRNADLPNLFKLKAGFKLPIGMEYVAGSMTMTHPIPGGTAAVVAGVTLPTADSIAVDFIASAPFTTACGLTGSDTVTLNNVRVKFRVKFNACPDKISQEIKLEASAENYCGKKAATMSILPIIYTGAGSNTSQYTISSKVELKETCDVSGVKTTVSDQIYIKNLGGGASPATSSGTDSVTFTIPYNATQMTIENWNIAAPYGPAIAGTNAQGDVTLKIRVPAGIAVNDSLAIPITYDLTPKVDKLCLVATNPPLCYFAEFDARIILKCDATGLNCTSSMPKIIKGSGLSLRQYKCCDVTIGNFVWIDSNGDGIQGAAEAPIPGVKVSLYKNGVKIAETTTATNGEYYFTKKSQSGVTWLGTGRDTAVLPLTNYDIVFGEGQYANGKLTVNSDNYFITTANDPSSDLTDSDVTANTVAGGTYPSILGITTPNKGNDYSFDAGFYPVGSIGDYVWVDNNGDGVQDAGDTPIKDVVVNLLDGNGVFITTTMTDADGKYLFPNLGDGTYIIEFVAPAGKDFVAPTLGGDTTLDSDAGVAGKSAVVTINTALAPGNVGRNNLTIDAGICVNPNAGSDLTKCVGETADLTDAPANHTWSAKAGNPSAATIDPSTGLTSALSTAGDYYFVLTNTAGCKDEVIVTVNPPITAGTANNPAAVCAAATGLSTLTLADLLSGEDTGGAWTSTGANAGTSFNATAGTLNQNGLAAGTYKFLYTVKGTSPCPDDTEEVSIVINNCAAPCPPKICTPVKVTKL
jgi:hypothetical protein